MTLSVHVQGREVAILGEVDRQKAASGCSPARPRDAERACRSRKFGVCFIAVKHRISCIMSCVATLRRSGGSVILSIPKAIVESLAVDAGSVVELSLNGRSLSVTPARRTLADRLAASPKSPALWQRDSEWLEDSPQGREVL